MVAQEFVKVDLSDYDNRREEIIRDLMKACTEEGFFYVVNHGISVQEIRDMFQTSKEFFNLPDDVKAKTSLDRSKNVGWEKMAQIRPSTGVADLKESMQLGYVNMEGKWPSKQDAPEFRAKAEHFIHQCQDISMRLLSCLASGLGFPEDFFTKCHDVTQPDCQQTLRCLHYHDITGKSFPDTYWRAGSHTDFDTLTLLFQRPGENGLEVCPGRKASTEFAHGDVWAPVHPEEDEIVCNIGDMLMHWSDDLLKSNFHRVRAPKVGENQKARYSMAYFNQANKSAVIQGKTKYTTPITAGEFLLAAMERNYRALQELQESQGMGVSIPV